MTSEDWIEKLANQYGAKSECNQLNEQGLSAMAKRIDALRDLLRDEYNRGYMLDSPWDCSHPECPYENKPMPKSCSCYQEATKVHIKKVLKEINQS